MSIDVACSVCKAWLTTVGFEIDKNGAIEVVAEPCQNCLDAAKLEVHDIYREEED